MVPMRAITNKIRKVNIMAIKKFSNARKINSAISAVIAIV